MVGNSQLPPSGGRAGYTAVTAPPGPQPSRALLAAALLIAIGAVLGLLGGVIWAAAAPRVLYQVYTLSPPTAYATNPETTAFIAADGIYIFVALGGGALLGLIGYAIGVRRYGPVPMLGLAAGAVAAGFLAKWLGTVLTGGQTFNAKLASSKPGQFLRAPISLGAHGAIAFWPVAAALTAGVLELLSFLRARRVAAGAFAASGAGTWMPDSGMGTPALPFGGLGGYPPSGATGPQPPAADWHVNNGPPPPPPPFPGDPGDSRQHRQSEGDQHGPDRKTG